MSKRKGEKKGKIIRPFKGIAWTSEDQNARHEGYDLQRTKALLMQLNDAAALVAGAGADAWDALAVGAAAPRELLLNVRTRVEIAAGRLREMKGSEAALAAAENIADVDVLDALDSSEATLAGAARRLHEAAHREWMRLPEPERERVREARDVAAQTVDDYLVKREEALGRGRGGNGTRQIAQVERGQVGAVVKVRPTGSGWSLDGRPFVRRDRGATHEVRRDNRLGKAIESYARDGAASLSTRDVRELNASLSLTLHGTGRSVRFVDHKSPMGAIAMEAGSAGLAWEAADIKSE